MPLRYLYRAGIIGTLILLTTSSLAADPVSGESELKIDQPVKESGVNSANVRAEDKLTGGDLDGRLEVVFANSNVQLVGGDLGDIHWETDGESISGRIIGPAGQEVAVLTGTISEGELSGDFKDAAGRVGTWRWIGTFPENVSEQ